MYSILASITLGKKAWKSRVIRESRRRKFLLTNVRSNARDAYYFLSPEDRYNWKEPLPEGACSAFQIFSLNVKLLLSQVKKLKTTTTTLTTKEKTRKTNKKNKTRTYFSVEAQV